MRLRNARDLLAGLLFLAFGLAFLLVAQNYPLGSARRMGPAYFPVVLSLILIGVGLATVVRSYIVPGPPVRNVAGTALALVPGLNLTVHADASSPVERFYEDDRADP